MATTSNKSTTSGVLGNIIQSAVNALSGAKSTGSQGSTTSTAKTSGSTSSTKTGSSSAASGYGTGSGYGNRETAFSWSDGSTTYSNATNWQDAAKEGNKQGLNLVGAVTYQSSGQQKANGSNTNGVRYASNSLYDSPLIAGGTDGQTSFTGDIYSKDKETGKNYTNASVYEQQVANAYGLSNLEGKANNYGAYNTAGYGGTPGSGNPYEDMLEYSRRQYDAFEDQIVDLNRQSIDQGTQRLEYQKDAVNKNFEESARQSYINFLQQQHALPEALSAQGITGGATESAQLSLQNAYQNSLSDINIALAQAINDINQSIYELEQSGNLEMAKQVLANSQAALSAYQNLMQNYVDYEYQSSRDQLNDARYSQEYADKQQQYESSLNKEEYNRVLDLINKGFTVNNAAEILGVDESEINSYISYLNQLRQLEIEKNQAALAKTLSSIKSSSGRSSSKETNDASEPSFPEEYIQNGVSLSKYGRLTLMEALALAEDGKISTYVNPKNNKIYFSA